MQNQGQTDRGAAGETLNNWEERFAAWWELNGDHSDGSHDLGHFQRVWKTARHINREEGGRPEGEERGVLASEGPADPLVLLAAAYFHDLVSLPKNHPQRREASRLSSEKTALLLERDFPDFPREKIPGVQHAILAHSFSAGVKPLTAEARILQDADRMEAIGAIGLARVFYTAGQLSQRLFDGRDPMAAGREPDDQRYALDHFQVKLLKLPELMNTVAGRRMAEANAEYLREFLRKIGAEIAGEY
jgi:uncharacterized protein